MGVNECDVAIVGAGPYGLSAAAHLRKIKGLDICVFGEPMEFWATGMPEKMLLRSPREASTISDPHSAFTLEAYEAASRTEPVKRVAWETFVNYGRWFEKESNVKADARNVVEVRKDGGIFRITLSDGATVKCRRVIVAAGIGPFKKTPAELSHLPASRASHCYEGRKFGELGKRVAIIGAGQSALESAAILHEAGNDVEIIARIPALRWIGMHKRLHELGPISQLLYSKHDVGPIGVSRLVAYPNIVKRLPMSIRDKIRTRAVRSAGAPWLIPRLAGVKISTGRSIRSATEVNGELSLILDDGTERRVDHILMGTGYRVDISRYRFLGPELLSEIREIEGYPDLKAGFSTSVPGLHFMGAAAARSFGPLMYFVTGTEWSSRSLELWIRRNHHRNGLS
jgi:pyridine nucleotide-disulfide oxidoreductase